MYTDGSWVVTDSDFIVIANSLRAESGTNTGLITTSTAVYGTPPAVLELTVGKGSIVV